MNKNALGTARHLWGCFLSWETDLHACSVFKNQFGHLVVFFLHRSSLIFGLEEAKSGAVVLTEESVLEGVESWVFNQWVRTSHAEFLPRAKAAQNVKLLTSSNELSVIERESETCGSTGFGQIWTNKTRNKIGATSGYDLSTLTSRHLEQSWTVAFEIFSLWLRCSIDAM